MNLGPQQKLGLGSSLAVSGGIGIVIGALAGWSSFDRPWGFLLGFALGVLAGMGATLVISGLIDRRRGR